MPITSIKDSNGNLIKVTLVDSSGSTAEIYSYGATITSWIAHGKQHLFLSKDAVLDGSKAIRGGIPIVFPQFGPGPLKQHGFARTTTWELLGYKDQLDGIKAKFLLTENSDTLASLWPYKFRLVYTVLLSENSLTLSLELKNTDKDPFNFTTLLHTYFATPNVADVRVHNLENTFYDDKVEKTLNIPEKNLAIEISKSLDRIYKNTGDNINVSLSKNEAVLINKENLKDIVVWNPWADLAKGMADFGDDEYKQMVCVEAGTVSTPVELGPGESWEGSMTITLS